jgi:transglutaminase-like putative cysteine protease
MRLTIYAMVATMTTALTLSAVFRSSGWFVPVMVGIVLVSASCALIRWSPLPSVLEPLTAAVAVLLWVTWLYARPEATFGVLPDGASMRALEHLARSGFTDIRELPPPVPSHDGLVLITVVGVAVVALVVDLLTVTLRRAALAGLPLLALFTVCAATSRNGVHVMSYLPAAAGFLMLLYADNRERVARWGAAMGAGNNARPAPTRSAENLLPSAPASLGRRVGAAAIGISVVVPFAIPGVHAGFGGHRGGGGSGGDGGGSVTTIDPIVSVNHDLTSSLNAPVLNYTTTARAPGYLRMTSLDQYSTGSFTASALNAGPEARVTNGLGVAPTSDQVVTTNVAVARSFAFRWLPMPSVATAVDAEGDWRYDPETATAFSASTTTSGLHYTVVSSTNLPTPKQLTRAEPATAGRRAVDIGLSDVSAEVRQLTRQLTREANTKFDAALLIQRFLTGSSFSYTTHPPSAPGNVDSLTYFLTTSRAGFCQQYATAMAVMARLVGIPSRVAVGFTAGTQQSDGHWQVTTHDAHAWPELYFAGYGWLPFEPTPRGDGQTRAPSYATAVPNRHSGPGKGGKLTGPDPLPKPSAATGKGPRGGAGDTTDDATNGGPAASGFDGDLWIALGAVVLLIVIAPSAARMLTRRRRMLRLHGAHCDPAAAWAELRDSTVDAGGPWDDGRSPRQSAVRVAHWLSASADVRAALGRLTRAEEEHRYAATPIPTAGTLADDVRTVRVALRLRRSRRRGLRAILLPPSTVRNVAAWWSGVSGDGADQGGRVGLPARRRRLAR